MEEMQMAIAVIGALVLGTVLVISLQVLPSGSGSETLTTSEGEAEILVEDINNVCSEDPGRQGGTITLTQGHKLVVDSANIHVENADGENVFEQSLDCNAGSLEAERRLSYTITQAEDRGGVVVER